MSDKKWYENITEKGVLCKITDESCDFTEIVVIEKRHIDEFTQEEINGITPLTAEEWWQFAPWKDISDLKKYDNVFLSDGNKFANGFIGESGDFYASFPISPSEILNFKPTKWLPLTQAQS